MESYSYSEEVILQYINNIKMMIMMEEEKVYKKMENLNVSQKEINNDIEYIKYLRKTYRKAKKQLIY